MTTRGRGTGRMQGRAPRIAPGKHARDKDRGDICPGKKHHVKNDHAACRRCGLLACRDCLRDRLCAYCVCCAYCGRRGKAITHCRMCGRLVCPAHRFIKQVYHVGRTEPRCPECPPLPKQMVKPSAQKARQNLFYFTTVADSVCDKCGGLGAECWRDWQLAARKCCSDCQHEKVKCEVVVNAATGATVSCYLTDEGFAALPYPRILAFGPEPIEEVSELADIRALNAVALCQ